MASWFLICKGVSNFVQLIVVKLGGLDFINGCYSTLARSLGEAGEIEPETEGMLTSYGIDYSEFPQEVTSSFETYSWFNFTYFM